MRIPSAFACLLLAACGGAGGGAPTEEAASPEPSGEESVFEPLTDKLERARDAEDALNRRAEELGRRIEEDE